MSRGACRGCMSRGACVCRKRVVLSLKVQVKYNTNTIIMRVNTSTDTVADTHGLVRAYRVGRRRAQCPSPNATPCANNLRWERQDRGAHLPSTPPAMPSSQRNHLHHHMLLHRHMHGINIVRLATGWKAPQVSVIVHDNHVYSGIRRRRRPRCPNPNATPSRITCGGGRGPGLAHDLAPWADLLQQKQAALTHATTRIRPMRRTRRRNPGARERARGYATNKAMGESSC